MSRDCPKFFPPGLGNGQTKNKCFEGVEVNKIWVDDVEDFDQKENFINVERKLRGEFPIV